MYLPPGFSKDFNKSPYKAFKKLKANKSYVSDSFLDEIYLQFKEKLIVEYFRQEIAIAELTSFLLKKNSSFCLVSIKKQKAFLKEEHYEVLKKNNIDKSILEIYAYWYSLSKSIIEKTNNYNSYLEKIDLETLLVRLAIIYEYERFKNPNLYTDNPDKVTIIEKILYKKLILGGLGAPSNSSDYLFELFRKQLSNFKENIFEFEILKSLYSNYDLMDNYEYLLDEYCLNQANAKLINDKSIKLTHSSDFKELWNINNLKNLGREYYFQSIIQVLSKDSHNNRVSPNLLKYNLHNLEKEIQVKPISFPASLYIDLFEQLDSQFNFTWNLIADSLAELKGSSNSDKEILNFIYDLSIDRTPIDSLSYSHEPNQEEVIKEQTILNWSSNDFNNPEELRKKRKIDLSLKPLIKFGTQHIAFSGIIANKNFGDVLATKVRLLGNKKGYGVRFESNIKELFSSNNFKIYSGKYAQMKDCGEFDLLAYKDRYLFIVEIKASKGRLSIQDIENQKRDSLTKLISQLDKNYIEIKDDFENLKMKLHIQEDFEDLILVPIAVTNNFEFEEVLFDSENYEDKIIKISAFELELILKDLVCFLYEKPDFLLWRKKSKTCPSNILYSAIKERIVWKDLINNLKNQKNEPKHHTLGEFNIIF